MSAQSTPSKHIFPSLPEAHTLPPATPSITTIRQKRLTRLSDSAKEYNNQPEHPLFREEMSKIQNIIYNSAPKIQNGILNLRYYIVQGPQAAATLTELPRMRTIHHGSPSPTTAPSPVRSPIAIIIKQRAHQHLVDGLFLCLTVCVSIALEREFNCGKLSISATYSLCP